MLVATENRENSARKSVTNDTAHRYDAYGRRPSGSGSPRPVKRNTTTMSTSGTTLTSSDRPTKNPPANNGALQRAQDGGVALAAAAAQRGRAEPAAAPAQLERQRERDPRTGHADRVAERDGAAVHVDDVVADAEVGHRRQPDRGERLVELEQRDVGERHVAALHRLLDRPAGLRLEGGVGAGDHAVAHELGQR